MAGEHHAFAKSSYFKKDRDDDWNLFALKPYAHYCIHSAGTDEEVKYGKAIDKKCKEIAIKRYKGLHKDKLLKIFKERYGHMPQM